MEGPVLHASKSACWHLIKTLTPDPAAPQAVEGMMLLEREERGLETHDYNQLLLSGMRVRAGTAAGDHPVLNRALFLGALL